MLGYRALHFPLGDLKSSSIPRGTAEAPGKCTEQHKGMEVGEQLCTQRTETSGSSKPPPNVALPFPGQLSRYQVISGIFRKVSVPALLVWERC